MVRRNVAAIALIHVAACTQRDPYFDGDGPPVTAITPSFENGNTGGGLVLARVVDPAAPTEEELTLIESWLVRLTGNFADCAEPEVLFGNRNAAIYAQSDDALDVLTPAGPVRGGVVDVQVSCSYGEGEDARRAFTTVAAGYDYRFGEGELCLDEDRPNALGADCPDPNPRRIEQLFANEYASFVLFNQAAPFSNWPDNVGYGFFFSQNSPRASMFWGQNPSLVYAGAADPLPLLAQTPAIGYETPEQGDRLRGGDALRFVHRRRLSDPLDPVRGLGRKRVTQTGGPEPSTQLSPNFDALWLRVPYTRPDGSPAERYLRVGQGIGEWCAEATNEGCGVSEAEDQRLNDTRLPIDARWRFMVPDVPERDHLEVLYPGVADEHLAFLDCVDDGGSEADCGASIGISLPSGTYAGAELLRASDEAEEWPWQEDELQLGYRMPQEVFAALEIIEGARYVDLPANVTSRWAYDDENTLYDGTVSSLGIGGFPPGRPLFVSYDGGFSQGVDVPAKYIDDALLDADVGDLARPGTAEYDAHPWFVLPEFSGASAVDFVNGTGSLFRTYGFPAVLPRDEAWTIALPTAAELGTVAPGDEAGGNAWQDSFIVVSMSTIDVSGPGGFGRTEPWKISTFAFPGDETVTFPAEVTASLPDTADPFKPDTETQAGENLFGLISIELHRLARWKLGCEPEGSPREGICFPNENGEVVFDVVSVTQGYFTTEDSCTDEVDNDGDGLIDREDPACDPDLDDGLVTGYETGHCQDGEDNDEDGLIDADDPGCQDADGDYVASDPDETADCRDNVDNDGDGWVDMEDGGCTDDADLYEDGFDYTVECNDGVDDDGDGLVDRDDPGCAASSDDDEADDTCSDGIDNNGDGWTDWEDIMCRPGRTAGMTLDDVRRGEYDYRSNQPTLSNGFACSNLIGANLDPLDDDGDGVANAADPDCFWGWDPSGESAAPAECADHIDNDGDGWVDEDDPSCINAFAPEDFETETGTCGNGQDDDEDGWIDALDGDCADGHDDESLVPEPYACGNAVDDDGDGFIDALDPECSSGRDIHEDR